MDNEGKTCRAGMGSDKEGRNKSGATLPPGNKDKTRTALSPDGSSIMIHDIHPIIGNYQNADFKRIVKLLQIY